MVVVVNELLPGLDYNTGCGYVDARVVGTCRCQIALAGLGEAAYVSARLFLETPCDSATQEVPLIRAPP